MLPSLQPGASLTSPSPSTSGKSTPKDVSLGMFPVKLEMMHVLLLFLFFIDVCDVSANNVSVSGQGTLYGVSCLGI